MKSVTRGLVLVGVLSLHLLGVGAGAQKPAAHPTGKARRWTFAILPDRQGRTVETRSPSGRYALAWTLPQHPEIDWRRVQREQFTGDLPEIEKHWDEIGTGKTRNYLVETRTRRVVATIPLHYRASPYDKSAPYVAGGNLAPNYSPLAVTGTWSHDEQQVVLDYESKWSFAAIYYARREGNQFRVVEIGDTIEKYVRNYLKHTYPAAYAKANKNDRRDPSLSIVDDITMKGNVLTLHIDASTPRDEEHFLIYDGTMRGLLTHGARGLGCRVLSLRKDSD